MRRGAAAPALVLGEANLRAHRRIDAVEAVALPGDLDGVAVDDRSAPGHVGVRRRRQNGDQKQEDTGEDAGHSGISKNPRRQGGNGAAPRGAQ